MKEARICFENGGLSLEGLYAAAPGPWGAVICHPHSLMGGEMGNPVVATVAEALSAAGFATLRFNFRGVGGSGGAFDGGRGEGTDLRGAIAWLEARGLRQVLTAGYSFGAWVVSGILAERQGPPALLVAPPIDLFPFSSEGLRDRVGLVVSGDRDPFCPPDGVRRLAAAAGCPLRLLPGVDHFFSGGLALLSESVAAYGRQAVV